MWSAARGVGADRKVIEADDADIFRNPEVHLLALDHCRSLRSGRGLQMMAVTSLVQKAGADIFHAVGDIVESFRSGDSSAKPSDGAWTGRRLPAAPA